MAESQRDDVWAKLPARLAALSVGVRMLPWTGEELAGWVADTLAGGRGTWATGSPGTAAEFPSSGGRESSVAADALTIIARTDDASFRLRISDKLRAFAIAGSGQVVLGLPKGRAAIAASCAIRALGPDTDAIDASNRNEELFDLGVGDGTSRCLLRTADEGLFRSLSAHVGRRWSEVLPAIGAALALANPVRVVETVALRIEVSPPGGQTPAGAYADFLGGLLQPRKDIWAGLLPEYAAPVAIFRPGSADGSLAVPSSRDDRHLRC